MRRMEITHWIGAYKRTQDLPVLDAQREAALLAARSERVQSAKDKAMVRVFFRALMAISRLEQEGGMRVDVSEQSIARAISSALAWEEA